MKNVSKSNNMHRRWLLGLIVLLLAAFLFVYSQKSSAGFDELIYSLKGLASSPKDKLVARPDPTTDGFTQILPANASSTRLHLPFSIEEFNTPLAGVSGFGIHAGGHPEGLNHEWIDLPGDVPVRSWADGRVTRIEVLGTTGNEPTTYEVVINYGGGLVGQHNEVGQVTVKKGQKVKAGDVIGTGHNPDGTTNAEFELNDLKRSGNANGDGTTVSPYDYLTQSDKLALVAAYKQKLSAAVASQQTGPSGAQFFVFAQPYLTNDLFSHYDSNGPLSGVWYSTKPWGEGQPIDILAIHQASNPYFNGNFIYATDFAGSPHDTLETTFTLDDAKQHILFEPGRFSQKQYATYQLGSRKDGRTLTIQFSATGYPDQLGADAVTYLERSSQGVQEEGQKLGVFKR